MAARTYQNFDLSLEAAGDGSYRARVAYSPVGESPWVVFSLPFEGSQLENLLLRLDPGRSGTRRAVSDSQKQACIDLGGVLFEAVFRDGVMLAWSRSQDMTRTAGEGLRLRLRLTEAPRVAGLPWELLYDRRTNTFVAQSDRTPLVRYLEVPYPPRPLPVRGALRILVVLASPTDLPDLDIEAEWHRIQEAMSEKVADGAVVINRLAAPRMADLSAWLAHEDVHILHFVGHGDFDERSRSGVIYFCDQYGRSVAVEPGTLGPFLHDHDPLRLVLLNACRSARVDVIDPFGGMAQGLVQHDVTAVVAMQFPISDGAALAFTSVFFGAVSDGVPVDQAATVARKELLISHPGEWATPVLFSRAPDGRVFDDIIATRPAGGEPVPPVEAPPADSAAAASSPESASLGPPRSGVDDPFTARGVTPAPDGRRRRWTRRRVVTVIAATVALSLGGIAAVLLRPSSNEGTSPSTSGEGTFTATGAWRLRIDGLKAVKDGCTVTLTDLSSSATTQVASNVYNVRRLQMHQTGSFRWQFSDPQCLITPLAGSGDAALPFTEEADGDTDAFKVPAGGVSAQVKDYNGNGACTLRLFDAATGQELDFATARPGADTVILTPSGRSTVYLGGSYCVIRVSAQP